VWPLISKAMSVPSFYSDAADEEKLLLLLLTDLEPEARQLLQQHLFKAAKAKLDDSYPYGYELNISNFPGSAFDSVRESSAYDLSYVSMSLEVETAHDSTSDSRSKDSSSADLECLGEPSAGLAKALDAALFITRKHGEPWHGRCTVSETCFIRASNSGCAKRTVLQQGRPPGSICCAA
jgi:hypothetical protein